MIVLVTGGRDYRDRAFVFQVLDDFHRPTPIGVPRITKIVHGACGDDADQPRGPRPYKGADRWVHEWALEASVPVDVYPAKWTTLKRAAGRERNARMLLEAHPHFVIAFPGNDGTANMVALARRHLGPMFVYDLRGSR